MKNLSRRPILQIMFWLSNISFIDVLTFSIFLSFEALPSAPRDVTFTKIENLESSSVEVKWDTPSITGGVSKSELKFKIKYCTIPGDSDDEIKCDELVTDAGSTRAVVKELKADTKYKFEVTAYSSDTTKGDKVTANYKTLSKGKREASRGEFVPLQTHAVFLSYLKDNERI